nr:retrotransposon Orf1 [Tanacetum cinerariifolium]
MFKLANLQGALNVYVCHVPQPILVDYYFKNLCVLFKSDDEVTSIYKGNKKGKVLLDDFEAVGNQKDKVDGDNAKDELISNKGDVVVNHGFVVGFVVLGARWSTHRSLVLVSYQSMAQVSVSGVEEGSVIMAEAFVPVMGDGGAESILVMREVGGESVYEFPKDRLMFLLGREIVKDIRKENKIRTQLLPNAFISSIQTPFLSKDDKPGEKGIIKPITMDDDHDVIVKVMKECKKSEEEGKEEKGDPENINTNPPSPPNPSISFITKKVRKLNSFLESLNLVPPSSDAEFIYTKENDGDVMFIELIKKYDDSYEEELGEDENFMIVENISSIIEPRLSQVVIGKPFVEISNMTYDLSLRVVKFINGTNEIFYKIPHKIEQYNSLSDLEKEHMKLVYLRNEDDKRREVEYVMNKILRFYKECLELGLEYLNGLEDEREVT